MKNVPIVDFPQKPSVHWEYCNPKEPLSMMPLVPKRDKPHVILCGQIKQECNYGPDRNLRQKRKWAAKKEHEKDVDHSQTASVSKVIIQHGHKVDCPTCICIKETFVLEDYNEVPYKYMLDHDSKQSKCLIFFNQYNNMFSGSRQIYSEGGAVSSGPHCSRPEVHPGSVCKISTPKSPQESRTVSGTDCLHLQYFVT